MLIQHLSLIPKGILWMSVFLFKGVIVCFSHRYGIRKQCNIKIHNIKGEQEDEKINIIMYEFSNVC